MTVVWAVPSWLPRARDFVRSLPAHDPLAGAVPVNIFAASVFRDRAVLTFSEAFSSTTRIRRPASISQVADYLADPRLEMTPRDPSRACRACPYRPFQPAHDQQHVCPPVRDRISWSCFSASCWVQELNSPSLSIVPKRIPARSRGLTSQAGAPKLRRFCGLRFGLVGVTIMAKTIASDLLPSVSPPTQSSPARS